MLKNFLIRQMTLICGAPYTHADAGNADKLAEIEENLEVWPPKNEPDQP